MLESPEACRPLLWSSALASALVALLHRRRAKAATAVQGLAAACLGIMAAADRLTLHFLADKGALDTLSLLSHSRNSTVRHQAQEAIHAIAVAQGRAFFSHKPSATRGVDSLHQRSSRNLHRTAGHPTERVAGISTDSGLGSECSNNRGSTKRSAKAPMPARPTHAVPAKKNGLRARASTVGASAAPSALKGLSGSTLRHTDPVPAGIVTPPASPRRMPPTPSQKKVRQVGGLVGTSQSHNYDHQLGADTAARQPPAAAMNNTATASAATGTGRRRRLPMPLAKQTSLPSAPSTRPARPRRQTMDCQKSAAALAAARAAAAAGVGPQDDSASDYTIDPDDGGSSSSDDEEDWARNAPEPELQFHYEGQPLADRERSRLATFHIGSPSSCSPSPSPTPPISRSMPAHQLAAMYESSAMSKMQNRRRASTGPMLPSAAVLV